MQTAEITYRQIKCSEMERGLFSSFIRRQVVEYCRRRENGEWTVKRVPFIDDWSEEDYIFLVKCLKNTIQTGGLVYGAFLGDALKGFVSVESALFGTEMQYADLSSIHVSLDMRNKGVGKTLFAAAKEFAGRLGASKLYISAHSAVESQAFYKAMGCVEAVEYNPRHVEAEPFDCQLECALRRMKAVEMQ